MAPLQQHMLDCSNFLGESCEDVNRWIDECFAEFGPSHRFKRHHLEGVQEAFEKWGERGKKAATVHILRDCRHIPRQSDYEDGTVDKLGLRRNWPVSAYIKYSDSNFEALVNFQLHGPRGIVMLGFLNSIQELVAILGTQVGAGPQPDSRIEGAIAKWQSAIGRKANLLPLESDPQAVEPWPEEIASYGNELEKTPLIEQIRMIFPHLSLAYLPIDRLINPLAYVDLQYVEELRSELQGSELSYAARFSVPQEVNFSFRAAMEPNQRSVAFTATQKNLSVQPIQVNAIPGVGVEVKFIIAGTPQMILVSEHGGRLFLRNGIHRAFLLMQQGLKKIPCILVRETGPPIVASAYPTFSQATLLQPRPPLLSDLLDVDLVAEVPIPKTHKVIRITADELVLPFES